MVSNYIILGAIVVLVAIAGLLVTSGELDSSAKSKPDKAARGGSRPD